MSESDLLAADQIDGLDGLENGQDGDSIMQSDDVKREFNEANIDDPVSQYSLRFIISFFFILHLEAKALTFFFLSFPLRISQFL